jgi:hypothetical protein
MKHVVLLGDSVFDNGAYVGSDPDVVRQLHQLLPTDWCADLRARDGAVISDIRSQLSALPSGTTHIVISVGGNDALMHSAVLDQAAGSVAAALTMLNDVRDSFRPDYAGMLDNVLALRLPTAVCTIYDPQYPDAFRRKIASAALTLLNDIVTREAFLRDLALIDLRLICSEAADFANPIEPSARGGAKIAGAILRFLNGSSDARAIVR